MYFRRKTSVGRAYLQIVESHRDGDQVRQQVVAALDRSASWPDIIADLDSQTETAIEHDGNRFIVRAALRPAAGMALRAAGVALPPTVRDAAAG